MEAIREARQKEAEARQEHKRSKFVSIRFFDSISNRSTGGNKRFASKTQDT